MCVCECVYVRGREHLFLDDDTVQEDREEEREAHRQHEDGKERGHVCSDVTQQTHRHIHTHTHSHSDTYSLIHSHTHIRTYAQTHTQTQTHTFSYKPLSPSDFAYISLFLSLLLGPCDGGYVCARQRLLQLSTHGHHCWVSVRVCVCVYVYVCVYVGGGGCFSLHSYVHFHSYLLVIASVIVSNTPTHTLFDTDLIISSIFSLSLSLSHFL